MWQTGRAGREQDRLPVIAPSASTNTVRTAESGTVPSLLPVTWIR